MKRRGALTTLKGNAVSEHKQTTQQTIKKKQYGSMNQDMTNNNFYMLAGFRKLIIINVLIKR